MKCPNCGETILTSVDSCPSCGTSLSKKSTKRSDTNSFQPYEEQELNLSDMDVTESNRSDEETASFHENPWEQGAPESSDSTSKENTNLEEALDSDYEKKIKSIPPDEFDIICKGIKETFLSEEDISQASLSALHFHAFSEYEIQKLIITLYEEMEDTGEIKSDKMPDWLTDNAPDALISPTPTSEIISSSESPIAESAPQAETATSTITKVSRKKSKKNLEELDCWNEFEEEATHSAASQREETHLFNGTIVMNGRNQILYSNLHPKRHKGKIAMVLIIMMLFIMVYPTLDDFRSSDSKQDTNEISRTQESFRKASISPPTVHTMLSIAKSDVQMKKAEPVDYSAYFDYFDSVETEETNTAFTEDSDTDIDYFALLESPDSAQTEELQQSGGDYFSHLDSIERAVETSETVQDKPLVNAEINQFNNIRASKEVMK